MSGSSSHPELPLQSPVEAAPRGRFHLLPLILLILALLDLRTELRLLLDHFTVTSLITALTTHPLAVVVLLAQPSLWSRHRGGRRS